MRTATIIEQAHSQGAILAIQDTRLKVRSRRPLPPHLLELLKNHKAEIEDRLSLKRFTELFQQMAKAGTREEVRRILSLGVGRLSEKHFKELEFSAGFAFRHIKKGDN